MRKFATVGVRKTEELEKELSVFGPEPLDPNFSFSSFLEIFKTKKTGKIKTILMDQKRVAGIGNIYSDEVLWRAGVHPDSEISKIPEEKYRQIFLWLEKLLTEGIRLGGDSMGDYRNIEGKKGLFQEKHKVYRREGEKCFKKSCLGEIQKKQIGPRVGRFCPEHQKIFL